jgi:succinyl-CoA synthetase beta subunit
MHLHEYQAKQLLLGYEVPIPPFFVGSLLKDLMEQWRCHGWQKGVVKIQVHAGGRGKAGGVKLVDSETSFATAIKALLGMRIVNEQTGPSGMVAHTLLVSQPIAIEQEYYVACLVDRNRASPCLMLSCAGGMEIEQVVSQKPQALCHIPFSRRGTIDPSAVQQGLNFLGWQTPCLARQGAQCLQGLALAFIEQDAELLEINPLVLSSEGQLWALDAKMSIDDNALFRHPDTASWFDPTQGSPLEVKAHTLGLAYVAMEGNIGCMVNGAGLAMATMDLLALFGGHAANFLDVGGSATEDKVAEGMKMILEDPKVKAIFINIFGGIMDCRTIAEGVSTVVEQLSTDIPIVVRLEGNHVQEARALFQERKVRLHSFDHLERAARAVVKLANSKVGIDDGDLG